MPGRQLPGLEVGDRAGLFHVVARAADEILLGEDDAHLDFRVSLMVRDGAATVSAVVRFHGALGRVYFFFVKPMHGHIVRGRLSLATS